MNIMVIKGFLQLLILKTIVVAVACASVKDVLADMHQETDHHEIIGPEGVPPVLSEIDPHVISEVDPPVISKVAIPVASEDVPLISYEEDFPLISSEEVLSEDFDVQPRRSYMTVRVISTSGQMCVKCWSGDHDKDRNGCSSSPSDIRVLSWDFTSGLSTKFWCDATWGTKYLSRFPVFGDGVPKKSSEWRVDHQGKIRTHEDGKTVNDNYGGWS